MTVTKQRWIPILLMALLGILAVAPVIHGEEVTVRVTHWLGHDAFQEEVALFEQLHPNIKIQLEPRTWTEHHERMQVEVAAGVGADLYLIDAYYFASLFSNNLFLPLENMVEEFGVDLTGFVVDPYFEGGYNGHLYALPLHHPDNQVLWTNTVLIEQAGMSVPRFDDAHYGAMTWEQFRDMLIRLTQQDGQGNATQYGVGPMGTLMAPYIFFAWNNGGELFDTEDHLNPTRTLIDEPEVIEAYEYLTGLVLNDGVSPLFGDAYSMFDSGITAFQFDWSLRDTYENMAFADDVVVLPLPLPENARRVNKVGGNSWAISRNSDEAEAAFKFLSWLTTDEDAIAIRIRRSGEVPAYMPQRHIPEVQENPLLMSLWSAIMWQFEGSTLRPWWFGTQSTRVMSILEEATISMLTGEASPTIALERAAGQINAILGD